MKQPALLNKQMTREEAKRHIKSTCREGWLSLVDEVYNLLPKGITINEVYQKWGGLQFDFEGGNQAFQA